MNASGRPPRAAAVSLVLVLLLGATLAVPPAAAQFSVTLSISDAPPTLEGIDQTETFTQPPKSWAGAYSYMPFNATLSRAVGYDVTFSAGISGYGARPAVAHDFEAATQSITIPAGETWTHVRVPIKAGWCPEPDEQVRVNIFSESPPLTVNVERDTAFGTIVDDDDQRPTLLAPSTLAFDEGATTTHWLRTADGDMPTLHQQVWSPFGVDSARPIENWQHMYLSAQAGLPGWLTFTDMGNGTAKLVGNPTADDLGDYTLNVTASDQVNGLRDDAAKCGRQYLFDDHKQITLRVADLNDPPQWDDFDEHTLPGIGVGFNHASIPEMQSARIPLRAVDPDGTGEALTFTIVDNGGATGLAIAADPNPERANLTWAPTEAQGPGDYDVLLRATDNGDPVASSDHTIRVTVTEVNRAPVQPAHADRSTPEHAAFAYQPPAPSDPDLPANGLTWSKLDGPAGLVVAAADGRVTWTPGETDDRTAPHVVRLRVTDDGEPALHHERTLNITVTEVNAAPTLAPIGDAAIDEGDTLTFTAVGHDADVINGQPDSISYSLCAPSSAAALAGATIDAATGVFAWPTTEADGPTDHTVSVCVTDAAGLTAVQTFIVTVGEIDSAPVVSGPTTLTIPEELLHTSTFTITDPDEPPRPITVTAGNSWPAGLTFVHDGGAQWRLQWTPTEVQDGTHSVVLRATDGGAISEHTITLTVTDHNKPPVLVDIDVLQPQDEMATVGFDADASDDDVTAGQPDTVTFGLSRISGENFPAGATINASTGVFTWTPGEHQDGYYRFVVVATDSHGATDSDIVDITVREVNVAPTLTCPATLARPELAAFAYTVTASDPDETSSGPQTLTLSVSGLPAGASWSPDSAAREATLSWLPGEPDDGDYPLTFRATDGIADVTCATALRITEQNQPPTLLLNGQPDGHTYSFNEGGFLSVAVTSWDTDIVGGVRQERIFGLVDAPANVALTPDGNGNQTFTFAADEDQGGQTFRVDVNVTDRFATVTRTLVITVNEVNSPPVLPFIADQTVNEGASIAPVYVAGSDPDRPADTLTLQASGVPAGADWVDYGDGTGQLWWNTTEADDGEHTVTLTLRDGSELPPAVTSFTIHVLEQAQPPALDEVPGGGTFLENQPVTPFTATANDPDGGDLTFCLADGVGPDGTKVPDGATMNPASGQFTWTPSEAQGPGRYEFRVCVRDDTNLMDYRTVVYVIGEDQRPPVLAPMVDLTGPEGDPLTHAAQATDPDLPAQDLTYSITAESPGTIHPTSGAWTWTPGEADGPGARTVTVRVHDGSNPVPLTDTTTFTVAVTEVNLPPAFDDGLDGATFDLTEHVAWSEPFAASDPDRDGNGAPQALTYAFDGASPAGLTIDADFGRLAWTPSETDGDHLYAVGLSVTDGAGGSDAITVNLRVAETNEAPVLALPADQTLTEGVAWSDAATASDADQPTQALVFGLGAGAPADFTIDPATGALAWTPREADGPDAISVPVTVTDGVATVAGSFTLTVQESNLPPVLQAIADRTMPEGSPITLPVAGSDPDIPANTLTLTLLDGPAGADLADNGDGTGTFSWTPGEADGPGDHDVTIRISDGALAATQTFTLHITEDNAPPRWQGPGAQGCDGPSIDPADQTHPEHSAISLQVTALDCDQPARPITYTLASASPALPPAALFDGAAGHLDWTPGEGDDGTYTLRIEARDDARTISALLDLTIVEVDTRPLLSGVPAGSLTIAEQSPWTFQATATDPDVRGGNAETLTYHLQSRTGHVMPPGGSIDAATGDFAWTPTEADGPGDYGFTVVVTDGTGHSDSADVTVSVAEADAPPRLTDGLTDGEVLALMEHVAFGRTFTAADEDVPAQTLTFSMDRLPDGAALDAATGAFTWTPSEVQDGDHAVSLRVSDGDQADTVDLVLRVAEVNEPPVLAALPDVTINEGDTWSATAVGTDADRIGAAHTPQPLTYTVTATSPIGVTLDPATGQLAWTPGGADAGRYLLTVRVTDGMASATTTFTITVLDVNHDPVVTHVADEPFRSRGHDLCFDEGAFTFRVNATDLDGTPMPLAFSLHDAPAWLSIDAVTGTVTGIAPEDLDVADRFGFTVNVTDGKATVQVPITLCIDETNTPPVIAPIRQYTINEGDSLPPLWLNVTDVDVPVQDLTLDMAAGPLVARYANGNVTWSPGELQDGWHNVTMVASDGIFTVRENITIHVLEVPGLVNVTPVLNFTDDQSIRQNRELCVTFTAFDGDGDNLTFNVTGLPDVAQLTPGTGNAATLCWTPARADVGQHLVNVTVSDGIRSATDNFTITVITSGGGGGGGGGNRNRAGTTPTDEVGDEDRPIIRVNKQGDNALVSYQQWTPTTFRLGDVPDVPAGFVALQYGRDNGRGAGDATTVTVYTTAKRFQVDHLALLMQDGDGWLLGSHVATERNGTRVKAELPATCCGTFLVGYDNETPTLRVTAEHDNGTAITDGVTSAGNVTLVVSATDNLRVDALHIAAGDQVAFDGTWNGSVLRLPIRLQASATVDVVVTDWAGHEASDALDFTVPIAEQEAAPVDSASGGGSLWLSLLVAALIIGTLASVLVWARRRGSL